MRSTRSADSPGSWAYEFPGDTKYGLPLSIFGNIRHAGDFINSGILIEVLTEDKLRLRAGTKHLMLFIYRGEKQTPENKRKQPPSSIGFLRASPDPAAASAPPERLSAGLRSGYRPAAGPELHSRR
ncbi:hypothetical protein ILYODFUR_027399 [Ilyodon furcidens]|uniref:Uncharacterized protein n=1 Tax=Ilyodon furcidens TaxID=33524 RepID=A0ABV0TQW9_9TELE